MQLPLPKKSMFNVLPFLIFYRNEINRVWNLLKINEHFEEADLEWLLLGEKQDQEKHPTLLKEKVEVSEIDAIEHKTKYEITQGMPQKNENSNTDEISQIIQLYKDGSFRTYFPKS